MRILLIVFSLFFLVPLKAQQAFEGLKTDTSEVTINKFDSEAIEQYKADEAFDYQEIILNNDIEPSRLERILNWLNRKLLSFLEWIFGVEQASGIFSFILQILPYAIGLLIIYLLVKFFVERNTTDFISSVKNRKFGAGSEEEELIKNTDLNALLQEAISQGNYRDAVRYYYLLLLKKMDKAQIILWEQQKTNEDFIREIKSTSLKDSFEENTRLYDFVWYGDFGLTKDEFIKAEHDFKTTNNLIKDSK